MECQPNGQPQLHDLRAQPTRLRTQLLSTLPEKTRMGILSKGSRWQCHSDFVGAVFKPWELSQSSCVSVDNGSSAIRENYNMTFIAFLAYGHERLLDGAWRGNLPSLPGPMALGGHHWDVKLAEAGYRVFAC